MDDTFEDVFGSGEDEELHEVEAEQENLTEETTEIAEEEVEEVEQTIETEPEADAVQEAPVEEEKSETTVPLPALKAERDKARAKQAEIDRLNQQIAEMKAAQADNTRPDPYDDPEGYNAFVEQQIAAQVTQQVRNHQFATAWQRTVSEHGEDYAVELADWADNYALTVDPNLEHAAFASPDPVKFLIDLRKRTEDRQRFEADPDAYVRQRALELGLVAPAAPAVAVTAPNPTATKKPVGPKSIAAMSNRERNNRGPEDSFDAIF